MKPRYEVVGAAIIRDGKVLALRRSNGIESIIHKFEFVGGKVEEGETHQQALSRECMEELSLSIDIGDKLTTVEYEYPEHIINLSVYFVTPLSDWKLTCHEEERWIDCKELDPTDWAPADSQFLHILKKGYVKSQTAKSDGDYKIIERLAKKIYHETYDGLLPEGQVEYMLDLTLTQDAMIKNVNNRQFKYEILYLNGEPSGFFAYCPAKYFSPQFQSGTFLSKIYLLSYARERNISSKIFSILPLPVVLTVNKTNTQAVQIYKHLGFKITDSVVTDIGGGFVMDDFIMVRK